MIKGVAAVWVPVTDMRRALEFYEDALELSVTERGEDWSALDADGVMVGLNGSPQETPHGDGGALIAFQPEGELEDEVERLQSRGVECPDGVSEHPWGRIVPFKDPDGNDLQLYAPPR
jgi:predicted enzyme related to lactoylglutathione lyase